jgi:lipoate-protein ligase A
MTGNILLIISQNHDPSFNLAAEEYLLRHYSENIIFLYINNSSVIIGKHQNALSEINLPFLEKTNINLFRRLSGGGTVYHDEGNINFCTIESGTPGKLVDFKKATTPILKALKEQGVMARHGKRNDLLVGYKKISGNACHVFKSRVMHHGTLLHDSNLEMLTQSLKVDPLKFKDKSVKSVRSEVTNISDLTAEKVPTQNFMQRLGESLAHQFNTHPYLFTQADLSAIDQLQSNKYKTWEWNYGYSPTYEFSKRLTSAGHTYASKFRVEKGIIVSIALSSNTTNQDYLRILEGTITGCPHEKKQLKRKLLAALNEVKNENPTVEEIMNLLF